MENKKGDMQRISPIDWVLDHYSLVSTFCGSFSIFRHLNELLTESTLCLNQIQFRRLVLARVLLLNKNKKILALSRCAYMHATFFLKNKK